MECIPPRSSAMSKFLSTYENMKGLRKHKPCPKSAVEGENTSCTGVLGLVQPGGSGLPAFAHALTCTKMRVSDSDLVLLKPS